MRKLWENKVSRRKLLGGAAATSAALPVLHELIPHQGLHGGTSAAHAAVEHHAALPMAARGTWAPSAAWITRATASIRR